MNTIFMTINALIMLLPHLMGIIKAAEVVFPGKGNGKDKLQMVLGILEEIHNAVGDKQLSFGTIIPALTTSIGFIVSHLNKNSEMPNVGQIDNVIPTSNQNNTLYKG